MKHSLRSNLGNTSREKSLMVSPPGGERRFATFLLGGHETIEFAIPAEEILEATPVADAIQPLPAAVSYLEGFMPLRDDMIPVINMKKRLGLPGTDYSAGAKAAVVTVHGTRFGLLFDDIKNVLMVDVGAIVPVHPALQGNDSVISHLIKVDGGRRTMELLDLERLLGGPDTAEQARDAGRRSDPAEEAFRRSYSRFVVFTSSGQDYGVPVERVQEITFLSRIDDTFRNDGIEGVVQLRGSAIPVLSATRLLDTTEKIPPAGEETRILVLSAESFQYGLIVDGVREIVSIPDSAIMHSPLGVKGAVDGFYPRAEGNDIMLIRVDALIASKRRELSSVARLKTAGSEVRVEADGALCRHLITADCYLVFSIGPNFAIALRDVQEIIEPGILLQLPAQTGFDRRVLNLRGEVVPVIDLRAFFGYPEKSATQDAKLIVARNEERTIALEVDHILTIHKQVKYQTTPSLNPQLSHRKDTLDRLIEFIDESGLQTHVLVVNIEALMDNHLGMTKPPVTAANEIKENEHDHHATG